MDRAQARGLTCAVAALKARQAHVLPRFSVAEDAARLAKVMSFAHAAALLAGRLGSSSDARRPWAGPPRRRTFPQGPCWMTCRCRARTGRCLPARADSNGQEWTTHERRLSLSREAETEHDHRHQGAPA